MALLNIFKKNKKIGAKKAEKLKKAEKVEKPAPAVSEKLRKISGRAYRILKKPHVTEKSADLNSKNQYIFEVFQDANKNQIKEAVADVYGVNVLDVNIINVNPKRRRLGRTQGWSSGYKKAIVKIKDGQKIEVLPR